MRVLCGVCRNPFARTGVRRLGHRLLCPSCFTAAKWRETGEGRPPAPLEPLDLSRFERFGHVLFVAALLAKALVFILFFAWASKSVTGDAALRGLIYGDLFTWVLFAALDLNDGRLRIGVGAAFEAVLLLLFLNRESMLKIPAAAQSMVVTAGFFFAFVVLKTAVWGAERALRVTGVTEPESL